MAITKDNFIVVYELGDLDSADFAAYYATKHNMDTTTLNPSGSTGETGGIEWEINGQLLGIRFTDDSEILSSEAVFNTQLLNPINDAFNSSAELGDRNIWGIVLGYNIPGGFRSGYDIISSTSRISRRSSTFNKQVSNKLYNRSVFQRFDSSDTDHALICSRIDAPNIQLAKEYLDNAEKLNTQLFANGTFYIDPYSDRAAAGAEAYEDSILDFKNNLLPSLNLDSWSTTYMDPYIDVAIPFVENDSFVWSWFSDRATTTFFQQSNALRVFFYNADYDGAEVLRDENGKRWPYLAMSAGYSTAAGAMSNPTIGGFLDSSAFFYALLRGATIGEAYLFSLPYLDWTMTLIGDPLTYCSFPSSEVPDEDEIGNHTVWEMMSKDLAISAAHLYKKENELRGIVNSFVDLTMLDIGGDPSISTDNDYDLPLLLYPANNLYMNNNQEEWQSQLKPLVDTFFDFPKHNYFYTGSDTLAPNVNDYLGDQGFKVSRILSSISGEAIIEEANLLDEGWWQFEFVVQDDDSNNFVNYHFRLVISDDENFNNILINKDSFAIRNWTYEKEKGNFVPVTFSGVSSSYIGRRV
ncbi:MAG: hypothetical protein ACTSSP_04735, partial [Candidatus Asgardarchaeia archaeon]